MLAVAVVVLGIQGWHLVPRFAPSTFMLLVPSVTAAPALRSATNSTQLP
jgi:hypothetical protein